MHKIMLVDDDINILKSLGRLLHQNKEWHIEMFTSPVEAIQRANQCIFDIVISDYSMPETDGVTFLSILKEIQPDTKRIVLTGHSDNNIIMDSINSANAIKFITKPWDDKKLIEAITECLSSFKKVN